jgi:hypothetical protein
MMTNRVVPEAASIIGALVKVTEEDKKEVMPSGLPNGMSVVMEYKTNSKGEWICFALNPDQWFDLSWFDVISRK